MTDAGAHITIKYEGGDADKHEIDMRLLGQSLVGFERILSDGIILLSDDRLPKKGERAPIIIRTHSPREGSVELLAFIREASGFIPLAMPLLLASDGKILWEWVSFVLKSLGGKSDAEIHMDAMIEMRRIEAQERTASEERWHAQMTGFRDKTFDVLNKLITPAAQAVAPVGPSVTSLGFYSGKSNLIEVDIPMADAIRAKTIPEFSDLEKMTLLVDGFSHHNKTLKVERPDEPGKFMNASIKDPAFDDVPNVYTQSAEAKSRISAVKVSRKNGKLEQIFIMDAAEYSGL